jgi:hypothetical protein
MKLIIDEREHALFEKCESIRISQTKASYVILSKEVLPLGDIIIQTDDNKPVLIIERKSFPDLLSSIKDGRYEEQSYRLLHSSGFPPHSIMYLLEGMFSSLKNPADKKIIYSAMTSLYFFKGFDVHRTATLHETAEWIMHMADKIEREFLKGTVPYYLRRPPTAVAVAVAPPTIKNNDDDSDETNDLENILNPIENPIEPVIIPEPEQPQQTEADYCDVVKKVKKENVTPENIGEIILCQIPGISSVTAKTIMKQFHGFPNFIEEMNNNPKCLDNIQIENNGKKRKINKSSIENIKKYLVGAASPPSITTSS